MSLVDRLGVEVPKMMRILPKDVRGYPIPYIVMRDKEGVPQFTVNDHRKVAECLRRKMCAICGRRLFPEMWLIGGPMSFFHPQGAFIDTPMHEECARYAIQVCPYLCARSFKRVDDPDRLHKLANRLPDARMLLVDNTIIPGRPAVFCLGMMKDFRITSATPPRYIKPERWYKVEFWLNGKEITREQARALAGTIIPVE